MRRTIAWHLRCRRLLACALAAALLTVVVGTGQPLTAQAQANHRAWATYTGGYANGGNVEFTVSSVSALTSKKCKKGFRFDGKKHKCVKKKKPQKKKPQKKKPPTTTQPTMTTGGSSSRIIGTWLGPAPNSAAAGCSTSKITYTFNSDGTWAGHLDYASTCAGGGSFTVGGTYTFDGQNLVFHFTMCPETCPSDTSVTVSFVDQNSLSMSGVNGYYHRQ